MSLDVVGRRIPTMNDPGPITVEEALAVAERVAAAMGTADEPDVDGELLDALLVLAAAYRDVRLDEALFELANVASRVRQVEGGYLPHGRAVEVARFVGGPAARGTT